MTQKKLENILRNYIISSLKGNFAIMDGYIIKLPIQDIVVGYYFEKSSSANCIYIWWFTQPLYIPDDMLHLTFGNRIRTKNGSEMWDFSNTLIDGTIKILLPELETHKNLIDKLEMPRNFYDYYYENREKNIRIYEATTYTACWIGLLNMYEEIENCLRFIESNLSTSISWIKQISDNLNLLKKQMNHDDILVILKDWKNNTAAKLKLG
jgi:hypothetical protein